MEQAEMRTQMLTVIIISNTPLIPSFTQFRCVSSTSGVANTRPFAGARVEDADKAPFQSNQACNTNNIAKARI